MEQTEDTLRLETNAAMDELSLAQKKRLAAAFDELLAKMGLRFSDISKGSPIYGSITRVKNELAQVTD
jgi:hypothetical protein